MSIFLRNDLFRSDIDIETVAPQRTDCRNKIPLIFAAVYAVWRPGGRFLFDADV